MASVAAPIYWCHQCHVQTSPRLNDGLLCTYCNGGFIEEFDSTEVDSGVVLSILPIRPVNPGETPSPAPSNRTGTTERLPSRPSDATVGPDNLSGIPASSPVLTGTSNRSSITEVSPTLSSLPTERTSTTSATATQTEPQGSQDAGQDGQYEALAIVMPGNRILILHRDMANAVGGLELLLDDGHGVGSQTLQGRLGDYFQGFGLDRLIQMLAENDQNRYGTPPASKSAVQELRKVEIPEEEVGPHAVQCAVCMDNCEPGEDVLQIPCKHLYHANCILPWLDLHNSCPVCRFELPTDDADYEARKGQTASSRVANSNQSEGQGTVGSGLAEVDEDRRQSPLSETDVSRHSTWESHEANTTSDAPRVNADSYQTVHEDDGEGDRTFTIPIARMLRLFLSAVSQSSSSSAGRGNSGDQSRDSP